MLNVPNLEKLIAHLEAVPAERFHIRYVFRGSDNYYTWNVPSLHDCGTAACIAGHCAYAAGVAVGNEYLSDQAVRWLGLSRADQAELFMPSGYDTEPDRYPLARAIATLKRLRDRFLATGEIVVDWGPEPGDEPTQPWSPPTVTPVLHEDRPLPESLTRLVRESAEAVEG